MSRVILHAPAHQQLHGEDSVWTLKMTLQGVEIWVPESLGERPRPGLDIADVVLCRAPKTLGLSVTAAGLDYPD